MSPTRQNPKINNSYESERSSGSGSSLSEPNDCDTYEDGNLHLPYLLKPPAAYETVAMIDIDSKTGRSVAVAVAPVSAKHLPLKEQPELEKDWRLLRHGIPLFSSQESSFEGFGDSPFGHMKRLLYAKTYERTSTIAPESKPNPIAISKDQAEFLYFYESVMTENSCNAVDMQRKTQSDNLATQCVSSSGIGVSIAHEANAATELSFNGKINRLTSQRSDGDAGGGIRPQMSQLNASYTNERSPDLFGSDDDDEAIVAAVHDVAVGDSPGAQCNATAASINTSVNCLTESSFAEEHMVCDERAAADPMTTQSLLHNNCRRERELLRRVQKCLAGVPPPPSMTIPQLNMFEAVLSRKQDILGFFQASTEVGAPRCDGVDSVDSVMRPTHTEDEAKAMPWKAILGVRQHGLCYNLSNSSERREYLSLAVIDRFVGSETASSYINSPSSAKKRSTRMKQLTQSPGNRLSHLAKRRAIFSSANLATTSQRTQSQLGPQILLGDKKKIKNRRKGTPKRMTPGSRKKLRNTPSTSARKRLFRCDPSKPAPSRETSKRALFQSPAKQLAPPKPLFKPEIANRVEKSKRALFSPDNCATTSAGAAASLESLLKRKRDTADDDDDAAQIGKQFRAEGFTPRALKIKSQSFCIGTGSSATTHASTSLTTTAIDSISGAGSSQSLAGFSSNTLPSADPRIQRAHSDMLVSGNTLTENQRKKLLWAVSQALQERKISMKHESFKQYASVLARVVRRIFQEYYQKGSTSNSETMLRLAKKYVYNVVSGRNADDIYVQAKAHIDDAKRRSSMRLSGYIGPEDYKRFQASQQQQALQQQQQQQQRLSQTFTNLFGHDSSVDSFSLSMLSQSSSSIACSASAMSGATATATSTQSTFLGHISQELAQQVPQSQPIVANTAALQRSSSKNNFGGAALRENIDCEQRRSAQKNFTGKDQRNVSPYASNAGSGLKLPTLLTSIDGAKAKRQISFDS